MNLVFDSHAHYDDSRFDGDRDSLLKSLPQRGVGKLVNIGADKQSSEASVMLAEKYDYIYATVGIHPHDASTFDKDAEDMLYRLSKNPKVVAIGEIGLDYHYDKSPRDIQISAFKRQLEIAADVKKPVVIHSREATADTHDILEHYRPAGIIHCFSGSAEMAEVYVKMGFYIGFTGVVTFKNAAKPLLAAAAVPLDRLLLETDCPYMAPEPFRGKRSDSSMIIHTAAALAKVKGIKTEELIKQCHINALSVYNIG